MTLIGCVGLGNMGHALAENLVDAGHALIVHDALGVQRAPSGSTFVGSATEVARRADVVVFSLPDGAAAEQVATEIVAAGDRRTCHVVDTSTVGLAAARTIAGLLEGAGIGYVDAPVSGGPAGARARTLAVMYAGSDEACAAAEPVLAGLSDRRYRVGERPGMAQVLKLANNFLSATALVATSEAVAFGQSVGLDMETMLRVLNGASGRSGATEDKFPAHVLTERYSSGFANSLMAKDVRLYLDAVSDQRGPSPVSPAVVALWERFAMDEPGADFTRVHPFVRRDGTLG